MRSKSKKITKDEFKNVILSDYRLISEVRESSALGRRDVLSGKGSFGIFGDGKELAQIALSKVFKNGDFREDLFYRLSVVPIRVPPLNEFLEDIPALVEHFSREMATFSGWNSVLFSEESVAMLQAYNWPGNVRELRNAIERILIMAPSDISGPIQPEMIPAEINGSVQSVSSVNNYRKAVGLPLREARKMFEKEYLLSQVSRFGGNISRTANFVGMERSALHRKMRALGIHSDSRMKNTSNE